MTHTNQISDYERLKHIPINKGPDYRQTTASQGFTSCARLQPYKSICTKLQCVNIKIHRYCTPLGHRPSLKISYLFTSKLEIHKLSNQKFRQYQPQKICSIKIQKLLSMIKNLYSQIKI